MPKVIAVEAIALRIPLNEPIAFATRKVEERYYGLVRVRVDDGSNGIGFCYEGNLPEWLATKAVRGLLAPILVGQDPYLTEGIWSQMYDATLLHGRAGSVMRAVSAVDIALWDRNAKAAGLPLWKYLGAATQGTVPAYASGGYYRSEDRSPEQVAVEEVAQYVADGFRAVKIKVGGQTTEVDARRLAAIREAVGPDILLMLDANNAWRDLPTALRALDALMPYDPYWIEEPFSPDDIENHARLRTKTRIPVAVGEIESGRWRHLAVLQSDAADILQTDAAVCGGITEFRRIAATAASFGRTICPHWFHDLHVHLVATTPNAQFVEYFPDDSVLNFRRLVHPQVKVSDGNLVLPSGPGLGFQFNEEAVDRYAVDAWA